MLETEVKILDINRQEIEKRLAELGAVKRFEGRMHAIYYDFRDGSLGKDGNLLRLRGEGDSAVVTFKSRVCSTGAKVCDETEVSVADFESMRTILTRSGFVPWLEMKKHRTEYVLGRIHIVIDRYEDTYAFIPEFLEIEAPDILQVHQFAERLGFRPEDCLPWDASQLIYHYRPEGPLLQPES